MSGSPFLRRFATALSVLCLFSLSACATKKADEGSANVKPDAPMCAPAADGSGVKVRSEAGANAMILGACFWCKLSEEEQRYFTEESERRLQSSMEGDVIKLESPERGDKVFLVLTVDSTRDLADGTSCVSYTELAHFEGKEVSYPKKVCFSET